MTDNRVYGQYNDVLPYNLTKLGRVI